MDPPRPGGRAKMTNALENRSIARECQENFKNRSAHKTLLQQTGKELLTTKSFMSPLSFSLCYFKKSSLGYNQSTLIGRRSAISLGAKKHGNLREPEICQNTELNNTDTLTVSKICVSAKRIKHIFKVQCNLQEDLLTNCFIDTFG